jgi:hypothetical protein
MVDATDSSRFGNSRKTATKTTGIRVPPARPCATRHVVNDAKPELSAHPADAMVKTAIAVTNRPRMVSTRISQPVSGIEITSAMR